MRRKTHIADLQQLRKKRLLARAAMERAGMLEFKQDSSAKWTDYTWDESGRICAQVQHDDLRGCTPEMIKWFFQHLACCTTWNGVDFSGPQVSIYHLWHCRDHVAVTPLNSCGGIQNLGFQQGARSRIHELTNEVNDVIYFEMETVLLDTQEFTFNVMLGNKAVGHVKHIYTPTENGCTFYAETAVGLENGGIINRLIPKFYTKESGMQWIHHNIQETGNLQNIAPILYANQDKVFFDPNFIKFD